MEVRNLLAAVAAIILFGLVVTAIHQDRRITNLERQLERIEQETTAVLTESRKQVRLNKQNMRLLMQGGWNGYHTVFDSSSDN